MERNRLEAFSDGVLAIIITIMVLDLRPPHEASFAALRPLGNNLIGYVLSFVNIGIYWNNHHHMMSVTPKINGKILWCNLHLLFWLSLVPFTTEWLGETHFSKPATTIYGSVFLMAAIAYYLLQLAIIKFQGPHSKLKGLTGTDFKGKVSPILSAAAIGCSFWSQWVAMAFLLLTSAIWFIPDRRIESRTHEESSLK